MYMILYHLNDNWPSGRLAATVYIKNYCIIVIITITITITNNSFRHYGSIKQISIIQQLYRQKWTFSFGLA